jgi:hypothetical protein
LIYCWFPAYGETEDDARPFGGSLRSACESACRDFDERAGGFTQAGFTVKARDANDRIWTVHVEAELVAEYHARVAPIVVESTFHFSQRVAELLPPETLLARLESSSTVSSPASTTRDRKGNKC